MRSPYPTSGILNFVYVLPHCRRAGRDQASYHAGQDHGTRWAKGRRRCARQVERHTRYTRRKLLENSPKFPFDIATHRSVARSSLNRLIPRQEQ